MAIPKKKKAELIAENEQLRARIAQLENMLEHPSHASMQSLLLKALNTIDIGVTITNTDQAIVFTNVAEARMHGYTVAELLDQKSNIFARPHDRKKLSAGELNKLDNWKRERFNVRKDSTEFPIQLVSTVVKDANDEPVGIITVSEDISERKKIEEELNHYRQQLEEIVAVRTAELIEKNKQLNLEILQRKRMEHALQISEERLISFINSATECFMLFDRSFNLQLINSAGIRYFENVNSVNELIGKHILHLAHRLKETGRFKAYQEVLETGKPVSFFGVPRGDSFLSIKAFKVGSGLGIITSDVTPQVKWEKEIRKHNEELKELAQELQQSQKQLIELNMSKDQFLSIIAHDLRGPIGQLHATTKSLINDFDRYTKDNLGDYLRVFNELAKKTYDFLEKLLEWGHLHRGAIPFDPQPVNLAELTDHVIELYQEMAMDKKLTIHHQLPNDEYVVCDRHMLFTILRNLLHNAIKYSRPSGEIRIASRSNPDKVVVMIKDNGVGIQSEGLARIFKLDTKYTTTGTHGEVGSGFGLSLCKEMVEKNQGEIWVESQTGNGTQFYFSLPKSTDFSTQDATHFSRQA